MSAVGGGGRVGQAWEEATAAWCARWNNVRLRDPMDRKHLCTFFYEMKLVYFILV